MSSFSLSLESLSTDVSYYSAQADYALRGFPVLAMESQEEGKDGDEGLVSAFSKKVKAFFKWMGEILTRFWNWITGRREKEKFIGHALDKMIKAEIGKKDPVATVAEAKQLVEKKSAEISNGRQTLADELKAIDEEHRARDRAEAGELIERYYQARQIVLDRANKEFNHILLPRVFLRKDTKSLRMIDDLNKKVRHELAQEDIGRILKHSSPQDVVRGMDEYIAKYNAAISQFGAGEVDLYHAVKSTLDEIDDHTKDAIKPDELHELLEASKRSLDYLYRNFQTPDSSQKYRDLVSITEKLIENNPDKEIADKIDHFLQCWRTVVRTNITLTSALASSMTLSSAFTSTYYQAWVHANVFYVALKESTDPLQRGVMDMMKAAIPSIEG